MNTYFSINSQTVHLWRISLDEMAYLESEFFHLLQDTEQSRAERFHFPLHKQRFIIAHGTCRHILSCYTGIPASAFIYQYGQHGKPYLSKPWDYLQFNLSHSHEMAVFAVCLQYEIGVDIEKIEPSFKESVAQRFFSEQEYVQLMCLDEQKRINGFYRIWSRKEAALKSVGAGLYVPMKDVFVGFKDDILLSQIEYEGKLLPIHIQSFRAKADYESAFAVNGTIKQVEFWEWDPVTKKPKRFMHGFE